MSNFRLCLAQIFRWRCPSVLADRSCRFPLGVTHGGFSGGFKLRRLAELGGIKLRGLGSGHTCVCDHVENGGAELLTGTMVMSVAGMEMTFTSFYALGMG